MTPEQITIDQALAFINKQQHKVKFMKDYLAANSKGRSHFISLVEALSIDVTNGTNRLLLVNFLLFLKDCPELTEGILNKIILETFFHHYLFATSVEEVMAHIEEKLGQFASSKTLGETHSGNLTDSDQHRKIQEAILQICWNQLNVTSQNMAAILTGNQLNSSNNNSQQSQQKIAPMITPVVPKYNLDDCLFKYPGPMNKKISVDATLGAGSSSTIFPGFSLSVPTVSSTSQGAVIFQLDNPQQSLHLPLFHNVIFP